MAKSSKLVAVTRGRILLRRRRCDHLWMFPGGQKRERESEKECLRREMKEELPKLRGGSGYGRRSTAPTVTPAEHE